MSPEAAAVSALIDRYVAGEMAFMPFWSAFMNAYAESGLSADEEAEFEPAYEIIYMGAGDPVPEQDRRDGVLDEPEVRAALAVFQNRRRGAQSV